MNSIKHLAVAMLAFTAAASATALPIVTFTLDPPDGYLAGAAGTSVGWGYTINSTNSINSLDLFTQSDTPAYVYIESFAFGDETPIGVDRGVVGVVPPTGATEGSPIVALWALNTSGLQYDIGAGALLGSSTQGVITLTYDVYSGDEITYGLTVNATMNGSDVNAEVFANAPAAPEPASAAMLALGIAALLLRLRASGGPGAAR